ncbi:MAG: hypothetical protein HKO84_04505, partial [Pseudomonadales bacterium]|nr:hypothetical protein [Pseudomonadales bacterium]
DTRPAYRTMNYGPGMLYRINIWKKWLFFEFEPTYRWTREPETFKHEGVASVFFRLEVMFSEKHRY